MSAQAILSVIAPVAPSAHQGSTVDDAVAFEGMLAAMLNGENAPEAQIDVPVADTASEDTTVVTDVMPPAAPPPSPPLLVLTVEETSVRASTPAPDAEPAGTQVVDGQAGSADAEPTTVAANDAERADPPPVPTPPQAAATAAPAAQATVKDAAAAAALLALKPSGSAPTGTPAAENDDVTPPSAEGVAEKPAAAPAAAPPAPPPPPQSATPAPLRPLADRTARQHGEGSDAEQAQTTAAAPAKAAPAGSASEPTPAQADVASGKADAAPAIAIDAKAQATTDQPVEGQPAETAPQTASAAMTREAASPVLSRSAIEATVQIAAQIQRRLEARNTRFEIALTPDELGRVDVRLDIDSEGRLAARLAFDNPAAAADLRGRVDELRRQLEQFGLQVADDAFEFTERDSGSSAFDRGQDARDDQNRAFARATRLNMDAEAVALTPRWTNHSLTPSGVDLKV